MHMSNQFNVSNLLGRWRQWGAKGLFIFALTYSGTSQAAFVAGSCVVNLVYGSPFKLKSMPMQLTDGFVLANRSLLITFGYRKNSTVAEALKIIGGYTQAVNNETYSTLTVEGVDGVGLRTRLYDQPNSYLIDGADRVLHEVLVPASNTNVTQDVFWLQELVVTNAKLYNGGQITDLVDSLGISLGIGDSVGVSSTNGSGCRAVVSTVRQDLLTLGGGTLPIILPQITTPTCDMGARDIVVALDPVDSSSLQTVGNRTGGRAFSIPLGNCGKDAKPYITFTDSSNKANRTSTLSLSPSSTATGVGIAIEKNDGTLVTFGAENASVSASNVGQFLIGTSSVAGTAVPLNLTAQYVRTTEALKSGNVKADAVFTVAYP